MTEEAENFLWVGPAEDTAAIHAPFDHRDLHSFPTRRSSDLLSIGITIPAHIRPIVQSQVRPLKLRDESFELGVTRLWLSCCGGSLCLTSINCETQEYERVAENFHGL